MNDMNKLRERIFELETQLGIKPDVFHMYEGTVDFPVGVKKVIAHMSPITRIEFSGYSIQLWGDALCLNLKLDNKPFKKTFTLEVAP